MPEEVKLSKTLCIVRIVSQPDIEKGITGEETSSSFFFDDFVSRKDVLEKTTGFISSKTNLDSVSEIKIDCKFAK